MNLQPLLWHSSILYLTSSLLAFRRRDVFNRALNLQQVYIPIIEGYRVAEDCLYFEKLVFVAGDEVQMLWCHLESESPIQI